ISGRTSYQRDRIIVIEDVDATVDETLISRAEEKTGNEEGVNSNMTCRVSDDKPRSQPVPQTVTSATAAVPERKESGVESFLKTLVKQDNATSGRVTLADVLNVLDGVMELDDAIIILTTNHIEKLDPALIRPGRMDMTLHMGELCEDTTREMLLAFYGDEFKWPSEV